jgi:hypothetical protein
MALAPGYEEVEGSGGSVADLQFVTWYTDIIDPPVFWNISRSRK